MLIADTEHEIQFTMTPAKAIGRLIDKDTSGRAEQSYAKMVVTVEFQASAQFKVDPKSKKLVFVGHVAKPFLKIRSKGCIEPIVVVFQAYGHAKVMAPKDGVVVAPTRISMMARVAGVHVAELVIQADEQRIVVGPSYFCFSANGTHPMVNAGSRRLPHKTAIAAAKV